jgi:hypothetical protein
MTSQTISSYKIYKPFSNELITGEVRCGNRIKPINITIAQINKHVNYDNCLVIELPDGTRILSEYDYIIC